MKIVPICLDVAAKRVCMVGGGVMAARRVDQLLRAGARVTVFAPLLCDDFAALANHPDFTHANREPLLHDIEGCVLCFAATDDPHLAQSVRRLAQQCGVLINVTDRPELCDFTMPSIIDRDPLLIAISTAGASPMLGRMLKARLESVIPGRYGRFAELLGRFRGKVKDAIPSFDARRRFWEQAIEGPVAELVLAGDDAGAARRLDAQLRELGPDLAAPRGEVFLVGAGPGDPDLLTFRALRLMQKADVVLYDRLVDDAIVDLVRRDAERIYVGKLPNRHTLPQHEIGALMVELARQGKRVLRLKGGDPFIFGRGGEEIEVLAQAHIPFQVCPGITAAGGCAAYSGIPLTHRDHAQVCIFVTGHCRDGRIDLDWEVLLRPRQTVAIYMGLAHLDQLMTEYLAHGGDPNQPMAIVDNGTRANQSVITGTALTLPEAVRGAALHGPAIVIVGSVVSLRDRLNWFVPQSQGETADDGVSASAARDMQEAFAAVG
jgi:uroporphyrin-III C-methyltransferase/precorrin-2 dehydrogenase/sirohydrochlorin ferrochelatase